MKKLDLNRQFEIPYNFDEKLLEGLDILKIKKDNVYCIYSAPFYQEYNGTNRGSNEVFKNLTLSEYNYQLKQIAKQYPNKMQLLLQRIDGTIMSKQQLDRYISLGFTKFCVGTLEQAKLIKEIFPEADIIGSITMKITREDIKKNFEEYIKYFNGFVLDFSYGKDIQKIKMMPDQFGYIILINSICNTSCDGLHHWFGDPNKENRCPGLIDRAGFDHSCCIRPMDLKYFDPYIFAYKFQDRGWPTDEILRDIVLYTSEYSLYPGIEYKEGFYEYDTHR